MTDSWTLIEYWGKSSPSDDDAVLVGSTTERQVGVWRYMNWELCVQFAPSWVTALPGDFPRTRERAVGKRGFARGVPS